ncbi:MAG TPA: STAS domain-containing protein [Miltoncostaeaceae bacterium]|nr:STAS domain-containing protein [Miltoncostaeaceae bacterium]
MSAGLAHDLEPPFAITVRPAEGVLLLAVVGELDLATAPVFEERVSTEMTGRPDGEPVVLDLSEVGYLDSSGFRSLVTLRAAHPDRLRLLRPSAPVLRILELTVTRDQFTILESL